MRLEIKLATSAVMTSILATEVASVFEILDLVLHQLGCLASLACNPEAASPGRMRLDQADVAADQICLPRNRLIVLRLAKQ